MIDSDENLVLFPKPCFLSIATGTFRVPDFNVAEINHKVTRRPLLIVELKAPSTPHNIGGDPYDDPNIAVIEATVEQLKIQVAHVFSGRSPPSTVIGLIGVGQLWQYFAFFRATITPTKNARESPQHFLMRFLSATVPTASAYFHLGTEESDNELDTLGELLTQNHEME
ncbi:hypothetical protein BS47DRAFT_1350731 [Hydnum rufescens UP504]|uniref:Uncharacterized protein n=1 Tax=Hydnum rufescens UP504 TaxID=1448309 RepID=A0A9P6DR70_9AGAM|nr:hypothetical protein BS47DRAFT_1350731 [Hydnum rufescens UP504]